MNIIYVKWCPAGHATCRYHSIEQAVCPNCDRPFYEKCEKCGDPLPSEDLDPGYEQIGIVPKKIPARKNRCPQCGHSYPWDPRPRLSFIARLAGWFKRPRRS